MQTSTLQKAFPTASITRPAAAVLLDAARDASADIGIEVTIAITDAAGHLKAFERADHAPFLTGDVAVDKAWMAVSFSLGTHVWNAILGDLKVAQLAHRPRVVSVGGGCPIVVDGNYATPTSRHWPRGNSVVLNR